MPTGIANNTESPTLPVDKAEQMDLPMPDGSEDANLPLSESQIDGSTDNPTMKFSENPTSVPIARTQGIAFLRAVLRDPDGAIANEIVKTKGFKGQHASNDRCKNVRNLFTGRKALENGSVAFVLATWCMLGGGIPATWVDPREGTRGGEKLAQTKWGQEMLEELQHLLMGRTSDLKHCKAYAKGIVAPGFYNWAKAEKERELAEKIVAESQKKPNAKAGSSSADAAKRPPSSPRQSSKAKRQKGGEKNKEVASSNKGDESASEPKDGNDSDTDTDPLIAEFTTGRKGEEPDFEPGKSWRDVGPPEVYRPPRVLLPWGRLKQRRRELKDACKDKDGCSRIQVELWNDLVLAAHGNIDEHPDRAADMHDMLVECSKWLPKSKANGKEPDAIAWRDIHSDAFEDATKKTTIGRCPFCPVEYRFSNDPSLLNGEAHDPQRFQDHQVNLCHDSKQELRIRKRIAAGRLGAKDVMWNGKRALDFDPLNDVYTRELLKSAHRLTIGMENWNNRLHQLELVHKIVETAGTGDTDKLRAEMLALRVCLQSNIVPPLVTEPTYILEKVRHEVNKLELTEVRPDGFAPSTAKYNCPPAFEDAKHEPYNNGTYKDHLETRRNARLDNRGERENSDGEVSESDGVSATSIRSYRHVLNEVAPFSNPEWLHELKNTDICFPVGCHKSNGRIVVVAYPPTREERAFFQTRFDHNRHKKVNEENSIGVDEIKFHNCFYGRDLDFLDDVATYIHHNSFGRLFQALAWAEGRFRIRFHEKKTGTLIKSPHRHNCELRFDFDAVLSFEEPRDRHVQRRLRYCPESLRVKMKARFDGSTMDQMVENYKQLKAKEEWYAESINEKYPQRIVDGAVFEDKNLGIRATMLGPVEWDNRWTRNLEDGYQFFDFWTNGIKVREAVEEYSPVPPFLISSIPASNERYNDLDKDASIRAWIDHVKNAKMGADGAEPSFIPYHELPHEHIYWWPWVNPLGPSWLERTFVGFFTVYNTLPTRTDGQIISSTKALKDRTADRAKHYLTVVEPEERGRKANPNRGDLCPLESVAVEEMFPKRRNDRAKSGTATQPEADWSKPAEPTGAAADNTAPKNGGNQAESASHIQSTAANASVGDPKLLEQLTKLQQQLAEKDQVIAGKDQEIEILKAGNQGSSETSKHLLDALKAQSQGTHDVSYHMNKALDLMFEENQQLKTSLAIEKGDRPEVEAIIEETNAQLKERSTLDIQVIEYRAQNNSLEQNLATTKNKLSAARSRIDQLKTINSDLNSQVRVLSKGAEKGVQTLVTEAKVANKQMDLEREWLQNTTVSDLGAYSQQFARGSDTPLSEIKKDLLQNGFWPKTPPASGASGEENREDNGGPSDENRENSQ